MNLIKNYLTQNDCYKANKTIDVRGIVLHSVGCAQPNAEVFMKQWNKGNVQKGVSGFIEANGNVYLTLKTNEEPGKATRNWGCASGPKGSYNNSRIQFEMCEPSTIKYSGGATFKDLDVEKSTAHVNGIYNTAVELLAYMCVFHNLDPMSQICSHAEAHAVGFASGHADPDHLFKKYNKSMAQLRLDVKAKMDKGTSAEVVVKEQEASIPEQKKSNVKYYVRKTLQDIDSQLGAYTFLDNAIKICKEGYSVFDANGKVYYTVADKHIIKPVAAYTTFVKELQYSVGAYVDGLAGFETLNKTVTISKIKNRDHASVKAVQKYLKSLGLEVGEIDGVAGDLFDAAVKKYQTNNGCTVDGEITHAGKTYKKLLKL